MLFRVLSIWLPIIVLATLSSLILNSLDPESAKTQAVFFGLSFLFMYFISKIDYNLYLFSPWPWYLLSVILLIVTFVLGSTIRGSTRWLGIGSFSLQTSEIIKPLLIVYISTWLSERPPLKLKHIFEVVGVSLLPVILVFIQPDFGTAMVILFLTAALILAAGAPIKHLLALACLIALVIPIFIIFLKPYQRDRVTSFLNPATDPLGSGYNAAQATIAVGSGKLFGRGLGQGTQSHLRFLPERHTDFVFASLVEELGLFGGILLLGSYAWLTVSLLKIAKTASTDAGSLIVLGVMSILLVQAVVNIGMNMGLLPITGITLPLVSSGGSSVLSFCLSFGLCLAVAKAKHPHPPVLQIH